MNNEKKTRLAALVGALGAVLLLVQSGRLPEVKSWLSENAAAGTKRRIGSPPI